MNCPAMAAAAGLSGYFSRPGGGIQRCDRKRCPSAHRGPLLHVRCESLGGAPAQSPPCPASFSKQHFEDFLLTLQESVCVAAAEADSSGKTFSFDKWQRGNDGSSGYGITRVMEGGHLLEKAATNISIIQGQLSETRSKAMSARGRSVQAGDGYFAGAISLVFHPCNPYVPTFRSDVRYFQIEGGPGWFGGGADLTPCYLIEEDARSFHSFYKQICDKYHQDLYQHCKTACDSYFFLPARKEHRGIGGIFFDDLDRMDGETDKMESLEKVYSFVREVARGFMPSFLPIAEKRNKRQFGERERQWQLLRRGRYLEFNLLYDRGVRFGLDGGRIESIMVSAPPLAAWKYNIVPESASEEDRLLDVLRSPRTWA